MQKKICTEGNEKLLHYLFLWTYSVEKSTGNLSASCPKDAWQFINNKIQSVKSLIGICHWKDIQLRRHSTADHLYALTRSQTEVVGEYITITIRIVFIYSPNVFIIIALMKGCVQVRHFTMENSYICYHFAWFYTCEFRLVVVCTRCDF